MAQVKLTLKDLTKPGETYSLDYAVEDSRVTEGQFTAAHLVGAFIMNKMSKGELTKETESFCADEGIDLTEARPEDAATIIFTLTDTNLVTGQYRAELDVQRGPNALYYTSALAVAKYLSQRLAAPTFLNEVWEYATEAVEKNEGARIANAELHPQAA